jgi:hypothetical protein
VGSATCPITAKEHGTGWLVRWSRSWCTRIRARGIDRARGVNVVELLRILDGYTTVLNFDSRYGQAIPVGWYNRQRE